MSDPAARELWERHAAWWQARFTAGADPEYEEQILPLLARHLAGARRILDVGTGEGQVARRAADEAVVGMGALRPLVVGVDPAAAQLAVARRRGGGPVFVQAALPSLPFPDRSFDAVVTCLVLEHVEPLDSALVELARLVAPGGRLLVALNHPLLQAPGSGWIDDQILGEQYWRIAGYLEEDATDEEVDTGVVLPFFHRPLSRYVNGLSRAGLVTTWLEEPAPPPGFLALAVGYRQAATIPRLLVLRAERPPVGPKDFPAGVVCDTPVTQ